MRMTSCRNCFQVLGGRLHNLAVLGVERVLFLLRQGRIALCGRVAGRFGGGGCAALLSMKEAGATGQPSPFLLRKRAVGAPGGRQVWSRNVDLAILC